MKPRTERREKHLSIRSQGVQWKYSTLTILDLFRKRQNGVGEQVLVIVYAFTRFTWLTAVKSTATKEVIKHLRNIFLTFGKPLNVVTDRGTAFTSKEFVNFLDEYSVKH